MDIREYKETWAAALRSGKYEQGKLRLRNEKINGHTLFCALGVLLDVLDPTGWNSISHKLIPPILNHSESYEFRKRVTIMNDSGSTFEEIADFLEKDS